MVSAFELVARMSDQTEADPVFKSHVRHISFAKTGSVTILCSPLIHYHWLKDVHQVLKLLSSSMILLFTVC